MKLKLTNSKNLFYVALIFFLTYGCRTVRQTDLDAWVGVPIEALDLHSFWITIPMVRTITDRGIEIRIYVNKRNVETCFKSAGINISSKNTLNYANFMSFQNCVSGVVGCDNIFYVKDGKVLEYIPVGNCYTDEFVQPEERYKRLLKKTDNKDAH